MQVGLLHGEPDRNSSLSCLRGPPPIVEINDVLSDSSRDRQGGSTSARPPEALYEGLSCFWNDVWDLLLDPPKQVPELLIVVAKLDLLASVAHEKPTLSPALDLVFALQLLAYPFPGGNT